MTDFQVGRRFPPVRGSRDVRRHRHRDGREEGILGHAGTHTQSGETAGYRSVRTSYS